MAAIREAMVELVRREHPVAVRQVFYRLVAAALIAKTEQEYKGTVVRLLRDLRLCGAIPYRWITDNTRWMRKPRTYDGLGEAYRLGQISYRRAIWEHQPEYVEVWCEKDALSGVLYEVTAAWDVPLMVTRGYASLTFLHEAAETIASEAKPAHIYYLGDWDPSGLDIARNVEERLRQFSGVSDITFERLAVTAEQIEEWHLPTRPTKRSDSRAGTFDGESVELDAIPPQQLRDLVRNVIDSRVDQDTYDRLMIVEESEREIGSRIQALLEPLDAADERAYDYLSGDTDEYDVSDLFSDKEEM